VNFVLPTLSSLSVISMSKLEAQGGENHVVTREMVGATIPLACLWRHIYMAETSVSNRSHLHTSNPDNKIRAFVANVNQTGEHTCRFNRLCAQFSYLTFTQVVATQGSNHEIRWGRSSHRNASHVLVAASRTRM